MKILTHTHYTGPSGKWTTDSYDIAIAMAAKDARSEDRLFSEIYDKQTNRVIGFASYDGKEM